MDNHQAVGATSDDTREGFYEKLWKDFVSLQRGSVQEMYDSAARWNALTSCARVRLIGYARGGPHGGEGPIQHIGFEFTVDHADFPDREAINKENVGTLIEFVDAIRSRTQPGAPPPLLGISTRDDGCRDNQKSERTE